MKRDRSKFKTLGVPGAPSHPASEQRHLREAKLRDLATLLSDTDLSILLRLAEKLYGGHKPRGR